MPIVAVLWCWRDRSRLGQREGERPQRAADESSRRARSREMGGYYPDGFSYLLIGAREDIWIFESSEILISENKEPYRFLQNQKSKMTLQNG